MHSNQKSKYIESIKATSLFGGVQLFKILINVVKSKLVAILIGPTGMGIYGLFQSTLELINSITNFGLETSSVRNIAEANSTDNEDKITVIITTLRRLVWITGIIGTIVCVCLSSYLSLWTFGNEHYANAYIYLSISLLFMQLTSGQNALMQGMRKYSYMAKANVLGTTCGLLVCIPLYYWWRVKAIIPVLIVSSFIALLFSSFYSLKIKIKKTNLNKEEFYSNSKSMLKLGFFISLQGILLTLSSYFVRIFIGGRGGVSDVGLYTAGFQMVNGYMGLIFAAMGKDYYPKLAGAIHDLGKVKELMKVQTVLVMLFLSPIITLYILFCNQMILLLYSQAFLDISEMAYWALLGVFFQGLSFPLAYYILAKGDSRVFFINELFAILVSFSLNIAGYYLYGLTGLGISYALSFIIYKIQLVLLIKLKYRLSLFWKELYFLPFLFVLSVLTLLSVIYLNGVMKWGGGLLCVCISFTITFRELEKRIGLISLIKMKIFRKL